MNKELLQRELRRKILHILTGVVLIASVFFFKTIDAVFWVGLVLLVPFVVFYYITKWFSHTTIGQRAYKLTERHQGHHTNGLGGMTYVLGVFLAYVLFAFDPLIVIVSILVLSFGDGVASYVGMKYGKNTINIEGNTKTLEGSLSGFIAATLVSLFFVDLFTAVLVSAITMAVEFVGIRMFGQEIPDNIYIPVIAGTVLFLVMNFL